MLPCRISYDPKIFSPPFLAPFNGISRRHLDRLAHVVPREPTQGILPIRSLLSRAAEFESISPTHTHDMSSRTGLEAEAISRLTDGLQPAAIRAILVQCLTGELAPSTAISRMVAAGGASAARAVIDEVTHRAANFSRASDRLVQDRVDELTQIFVENVEGLADVRDSAKTRPGADSARASHPQGFPDRDERRISE